MMPGVSTHWIRHLVFAVGIVGLAAVTGCGSSDGSGGASLSQPPPASEEDDEQDGTSPADPSSDTGVEPGPKMDTGGGSPRDAGSDEDDPSDDVGNEDGPSDDVGDEDEDGPSDDVGDDDDDENLDSGTADGEAIGDAMDDDNGDGEEMDPRPDCGGDCKADESCVRQNQQAMCISDAKLKCSSARGKGMIRPGGTINISGDFRNAPNNRRDVLQTSCADELPGPAPEKVYRFSVSEASRIEYTSDFDNANQIGAKLEFRQDHCRSNPMNQRKICRNADGSFYAPAGSTFYLVVENDAGVGKGFSVTLNATSVCSFGGPGEYGCKNDNVYVCEFQNGMASEKQTSTCSRGCMAGHCVGGSCSAPITIRTGSSFSNTYTGDLSSFRPKLNFANASHKACTIKGRRPDSRGPEMIFKLEGVSNGQTIEVNTNADSNQNLIYLSNNCKSSANVDQIKCAAAAEEKLSTTVQAAGDYYLYIDKRLLQPNPYEYTIDVN